MNMKKTRIEIPVSRQIQRGFTLVELMIVVAIITVLVTIAIPSYTKYTVKSNRTAAESFIMGVANKQEQYILDARQYAGVAAVAGDATGLTTLGVTVPADVSKSYTITIGSVTSAPPAYKITATPIGGQLTNDTNCGAVSIDQAGTKTITGTDTVANCW